MLRTSANPMQMVLEDNLREDQNPAFALQEAPTVKQDINELGSGEDRQPGNDGLREEMGIVLVPEPVACSSHDEAPERV